MADMIALSPEEEARADRFFDWLQDSGGHLHSSLHLARHASMGLGIFARAPLEPDIEAIVVPASVCITTSSSKRQIAALLHLAGEDDAQMSKLDVAKDKWWIVLYLALHYYFLSTSGKADEGHVDRKEEARPPKRAKTDVADESDHGASMQHVAYVALMQSCEACTPLMYNEEHVDLLRSTPLHANTIARQAECRNACIASLRWLTSQLDRTKAEHKWAEGVFDPLSKELQTIDDSLSKQPADHQSSTRESRFATAWFQADNAYTSRAFPPSVINATGAPVLLPGYDLFNHARASKVTWFLDCQSSKEQEIIRLLLHYPLEQGQQATNTYGPRPNEELLASYGFADPDMLDDAVTLKLNDAKGQHYWRFGESCPAALYDEVVRRCHDAGNDGYLEQMGLPSDVSDEVRKSAERVFALEAIAEMLEEKLKVFDWSQAEVDGEMDRLESLHSNDKVAAWKNARQAIRTYRQGQRRILESGLKRTMRDIDEASGPLEDYFEDGAGADGRADETDADEQDR